LHECGVDHENHDPILTAKTNDQLKSLDNSAIDNPAFPGPEDDDFEPKIITDPNLKAWDYISFN